MEESIDDEGEGSIRRTCFVTGGSGYIGYNILLELVSCGLWDITCLYYGGDKDIIKKRLFDLCEENSDCFRVVEGDILKVDTVHDAMPEEVDCVFHVAGSIAMNYKLNKVQYAINVDGTKNVLEVAIKKKAKRFIHTSSTSVYLATSTTEEITEESYKGAMEYGLNYGQTKFLGEKLVLEAGKRGDMDVVVIQPNFVLGENDILGVGFSQMFNKVYRKKLPMVPPGGGSYVDVKELARSQLSAYENGRNGECYILGGEFLFHKGLVKLIGEELGMDGKDVPQFVPPYWLLYSYASVAECISNCRGEKQPKITTQQIYSITRIVRVDCNKAIEELGYKVTPVKELVRRQIKYMKDHKLFDEDL